MNQILERLKKYESDTPSNWREEAEFRIKNRRWLRYSQAIALTVLNKMDESGLTQKALAEKMGCSQQYVSRIVKGGENLSLETISKIEEALDLDLINGALSTVWGYTQGMAPSSKSRTYLSEGEQAPYGAKRGADEERMEEDER